MNEEQLKKAIETLYDDSREDSLWTIITGFYSRQMRSTTVILWTLALVFFAISVVFAVLFFHAEQIRWQIAYAALFIVIMEWVSFVKVFAWLLVHRNGIKREIKRLELRIAELAAARK
jgi:hypothetical protein